MRGIHEVIVAAINENGTGNARRKKGYRDASNSLNIRGPSLRGGPVDAWNPSQQIESLEQKTSGTIRRGYDRRSWSIVPILCGELGAGAASERINLGALFPKYTPLSGADRHPRRFE